MTFILQAPTQVHLLQLPFFFLWQVLTFVFAPIKVYENIYLSVSYDFSKFDESRKIKM
jgi:hypothetical protein